MSLMSTLQECFVEGGKKLGEYLFGSALVQGVQHIASVLVSKGLAVVGAKLGMAVKVTAIGKAVITSGALPIFGAIASWSVPPLLVVALGVAGSVVVGKFFTKLTQKKLGYA